MQRLRHRFKAQHGKPCRLTWVGEPIEGGRIESFVHLDFPVNLSRFECMLFELIAFEPLSKPVSKLCICGSWVRCTLCPSHHGLQAAIHRARKLFAAGCRYLWRHHRACKLPRVHLCAQSDRASRVFAFKICCRSRVGGRGVENPAQNAVRASKRTALFGRRFALQRTEENFIPHVQGVSHLLRQRCPAAIMLRKGSTQVVGRRRCHARHGGGWSRHDAALRGMPIYPCSSCIASLGSCRSPAGAILDLSGR